MEGREVTRRLAWHGMVLVLAGLLAGAALSSFANPRMGLSAHTGSVLNGVWLIAAGAVWPMVSLAPGRARAALALLVWGSYGVCAGLVLAAAFGTSRSTPLHGAGHAGLPWQETLVEAVLNVSALAVLVASALIVWGLRRAAPPR